VDLSKTKNEITIELSEPSFYTFGELPRGEGIRFVINNAGESIAQPIYPRLSEIIDRISVYKDGLNAVVEIRTMGSYKISQYSSKDKRRINVSVIKGVASASPAPAEKPKAALPRKVEKPQAVVRPQPAVEKAEPVPQAPVAMVAKPDSAEDREIAVTKPDSAETDTTAASGTIVGKNLVLPHIAGVTLILCLLIFLKYLRRRAPESMPETPEDDLEGATLMLDPETRRRMVGKLVNQGWSAGEIARELRLGTKEVQSIVDQLKETSR
jgi:hypothetical protein